MLLILCRVLSRIWNKLVIITGQNAENICAFTVRYIIPLLIVNFATQYISLIEYFTLFLGWKYSLKSKRINTQTQNDLFIFAKFIITLLIMYFIYILHGSFVGLDLEARNVSLTPLVTKKITSQKTLYIAIRAPSVSRWTSLNQITRTHLLYFITTISVVPYRFLRFVPVNLKPNDNIFLLCHDGYHFLLTLINRITL